MSLNRDKQFKAHSLAVIRGHSQSTQTIAYRQSTPGRRQPKTARTRSGKSYRREKKCVLRFDLNVHGFDQKEFVMLHSVPRVWLHNPTPYYSIKCTFVMSVVPLLHRSVCSDIVDNLCVTCMFTALVLCNEGEEFAHC